MTTTTMQLEFVNIFSTFGKKIEKSFTKIIDDKPTIYDDKLVKFYNETHIGVSRTDILMEVIALFKCGKKLKQQ